MEELSNSSLLPIGYLYSPGGYLWYVLPLEKFEGLPEKVQVGERSLSKKSEFHVTIINARLVAQEIAGSDPEAVADPEAIATIEQKLQLLLRDYVAETPIEFSGFKQDLRLAITSEFVSIAARCRMKNVEGYFERIKETYGVEIPLQPAHVSIYTQSGAAVGIDSYEQMESFEKIQLPQVQQVLDAISAKVI